jgi:ABC-type transport system involved in cytochrome c biogenesis permease component
MPLPVGGQTNMRALLLGVILFPLTLPCLAQTVLKSEPLVLAPYEVAFVQDPACAAGKVLKVTGAIRGLHRRKACVALAAEQASLAVATP